MDTMDEQERARVGALVRRARKSKQWTQKELADAAGVAPGTVVSVEGGKPTRAGNLRAVLDAAGIPPLTDTPRPVDKRIGLALDIVQRWLEAVPEDELDDAVHELVRFAALRH